MSEIAQIIDTLESRLEKLIAKIEGLEKTSRELQQELDRAAVVMQKQSKEIETLKTQQETLRMNAFCASVNFDAFIVFSSCPSRGG